MVKDGIQSYQLPSRRVVYALWEPPKEELERLQKQQIILLLGTDETLEWCNTFALVSKVKIKVSLWQDPTRLKKALIRPVHRGPMLIDIPTRLVGIKYLTLINASSSYHNQKVDERSSYLTMFSCLFGRYKYIRLLFRAAPAGDMLQKKKDEIFQSIPNVFGIAYDIIISGFDEQSKDHDETQEKVPWVCRHANVKFNKCKCPFRCTSIPFFGKGISQQSVTHLWLQTYVSPAKIPRLSVWY